MPIGEPPTSDVKEVPVTVTNSSGDAFEGDLRYPAGKSRLPVVMVCHGFTAHKDWGPFPYIGKRLAERGLASIVFNFSHNGIGRNPRRFSEPEKFSRNTIGKELEDVAGVVNALTRGKLGGDVIESSRIGIMGHSRGGGLAILSASLDARLSCVATWSGVATFYRYTEHQKTVWERDGYLPVTIRGSRTKLRYGLDVLRDLEVNKDRYDLHAAVRALNVPLLIVHGREDLSVRASEARELYEVADPKMTTLVMLEGVGHMYGVSHPFSGQSAILDHIIDTTANWFHSHLSGA
jgi:dienelactone hydrolase